MDRTGSLYGIIADVVASETKFLRHYVGKVLSNVDTDRKGKILVSIPELGWDNQSTGAWCAPRIYNRGLSTPKTGEYVEVYFMNGDKNRPVYLAGMGDMMDMLPSKRNSERDHIIFENDKKAISYDENKKELTVDFLNLIIGKNSTVVELNGNAEKAVLGNKLITWLTSFVNAYISHTHISGAPGAPTGTPSATISAPVGSDFCSTLVKLS